MSSKPKANWDLQSAEQTHNSAHGSAFDTNNDNLSTAETTPVFNPPLVDGEVGTLGPYRIVKQLGRGGMGAVYLAFDERLKRKVALKVMLPKYAINDDARTRFVREARAAAAITHDHIVTIYEADIRDATPYIAMQLLQGQSLEQYAKNHALSVGDVMRIGREIALGLAAAHEVGLIHRDIKPANVWIELPSGRAKILDFGLAKPTNDEFANTEQTASGVIIGTPSYMAPEQARGEAIDFTADLFSLGVVLYRLLTGQFPFQGANMIEIVMAIVMKQPPPVQELNPQVPAALAQLVHQLLAKDARTRPVSASWVAQELMRFAHGAPLVVVPLPANSDYRTATMPHTGADPFADLDTLGRQRVQEPMRKSTLKSTHTSNQKSTPKWPFLAIGALMVAIALLVPQLITILTPKGTLIIESSDPSIEITVKKNGAVVVDKSRQREFELAVGDDYRIDMLEKEGLKLSTDKFEITRGGKAVVTVRVEKPKEGSKASEKTADKPKVATVVKPATSDRNAASFALSIGAWVIVNTHKETVKTVNKLPAGDFKLLSIDLYEVAVTDSGMEQFKDCNELQHLNIGWSQVTDVGLAHVAKGNNLLGLGLNGTKVTDLGMAMLKEQSNLRNLFLNNTAVTDAGMANFKNCHDLEWLEVCRTSIGDTGLAHIGSWKKLLYVYLAGSRITNRSLALFRESELLTEIQLNGTAITDEGLAHLANLTELTYVGLDQTSITNAGLAHLRKCRNLRKIGLSDTNVTDEGLAVLKPFTTLTTVTLNRVPITDVGLACFENSTSMEAMDLVNTKITDASLERLAMFTKLVHVNITGTQVTKEGVDKLAAARPKCKIIWDGGTIEPRAQN